jgi:hypothetical protein
MSQLNKDLYDKISEIPLFDVHTHMDASHLSARGLHDVLLYHMVISDLYSAGCPDGARLSADPDEDEITFRIERAIPYLPYIENTSCFWGVRLILKELYNWDKPVTSENWRELHRLIKDKSKDPSWARTILKKSNIKKICTELYLRRDGSADDLLQYCLEWAFFTRSQWGQYDTALLELEYAWNQDTPGSPLPVTLDRASLNLTKTIKTIDDVKTDVRHYIDRIPYNDIICTASHFSTDISYRQVTEDEMIDALKNRDDAGETERDIYANYINEMFISSIEAGGKDIMLNFSIGAEPLPYETGSKLKADTLFELAALFCRYPKVKFCMYLSSEHMNQTMSTLCRELPNVSVAGYWWHNFFPSSIRKIIEDRLDMISVNKQLGFFSDAYCAEWAFAKSIIVKKQLAQVLESKINQEQYTFDQAITIAGQILHETPKQLAGIKM